MTNDTKKTQGSANEDITHVEAQKQDLRNSPIKLVEDALGQCYWNGTLFSEYSQVCMSNQLYQCQHDGSWYGPIRRC